MLPRIQFLYHEKHRDVLVTSETENSIKGIDLSQCASDDERNEILKTAEDVDLEGKVDEAAMVEVDKIRKHFKRFKHFSKSKASDIKR